MIYGALALLITYFFFNFPRKRKFPIELTHNCLMTRYPIYFLSGQQSFFYHRNYFNQIPEFLREHGYEVQEHSSIAQLVRNLPNGKPVHLICNEEDFLENREQLVDIREKFQSVSLISAEETLEDNNLKPFPVSLHVVDLPKVPGSLFAQWRWAIHQFWSQSRQSGHKLGIPGWSEEIVSKRYLSHFHQLAESDWTNS